MEFRELTKNKVEVIKSIIVNGSPNFIIEKPWLKIYPGNPVDLIDNFLLLNKVVAVAVLISGASAHPNNLYSYDIIRKDGNIFDTDRHLLKPSGLTIFEQKEIHKDFPEHHLPKLPDYYAC